MERQYNELQKAYTKEVLASMIKVDILAPGSLNLVQVCIASSLIISRTLQISLNLQPS